MILLIDNFDSFTFNLVQVLQKLGADPAVFRNNQKEMFSALEQNPVAVVISPGPGRPENSGLCLEFLKRLDPKIPVLGVCLGHQVLGYYTGARVEVAGRIMHGKTSQVHHQQKGLFEGIPSPFEACRYHSLLVSPAENNAFRVTARTEQEEIMGLEFLDRPWMGVQFHPESIFTPWGPKIMENFLKMAGKERR